MTNLVKHSKLSSCLRHAVARVALPVLLLLSLAGMQPAAAFIPVQTYYVPLPEDELLSSFRDMTTRCSACTTPRSPIRTLISIVVSADGTQILYDQHEDGYERDPSNPAGLKPGGTTEIWGDGDLSNGVAPGYPSDLLNAGDVISLDNDVSVPSSAIFFDGADKIVASFPVVMTRAAIPTGPGALQAGAMEALPIERWGTSYVAPVGVNTRDSNSMFQYNALYVMARTDNTVCAIDPDPARTGEPGEGTQTLNEGKTLVVENVHDGGTVDCDKNVHVDQITGDIGVNYETRWFSLTPTSRLANDYYGPVGNPRDKGETFVYVHNPTGSSMTVQCQTDAGSCGSRTLSPGETWRTSRIPDGSGVRVFSNNAGDRFAALSVIDYGGQIYDWGYTLEPRKELSTQALVGLGLGCTNSNSCDRSRSVIWVTPTADTTIYVNRDGAPASCPGGGGADESHFVRALEAVLLTDPSDNDMTGARIYTCDENAPFVAAWGQDPERSRSGDNEGLDMGTLVPPLPRVSATKFAALFIDADGDGDFSPGDTIRYSIRVSNNSQFELPVDAINVQDSLPTAASYVPGSTTYQADDSTATIPVADDTSGTAFPLDDAGKNNLAVIPGNQAATFAFDVLIDVTRGDCDDDFVNTGEVRFPVDSTDPIPLEDRRRLTCSPAIDLEKSTNGDDADSPTGPVLAVGAQVDWEYVVTNIGNTPLDSIQLFDDKLVTVGCPQPTLAPGASMTCTETGTAQAGQYSNTGYVTANHEGTTVKDHDPSHYFGGNASIDIEKSTNGEDADTQTGPVVEVGSPVTWNYVIHNTGDLVLSNVVVTDNQGVTVTCPPAASTLDPGEKQVCTATGTAAPGQYANIGTVTGTPPIGANVTDTDPSHYLGVTPSVSIEKATNTEDADTAPGPRIAVGGQVSWTYEVENTGETLLAQVGVVDSDPGVTVNCPLQSLTPGQSMTCTATGTATAGQYSNTGTVIGATPRGTVVKDTDPSHYFGAQPGLTLQKSTNGQDADTAPGPSIEVGDPVTWTYLVTNTGNEPLTGISVTDDPMPTGGITCDSTTLAPGESTNCHASGIAVAGLFANTATATGAPPSGPNVTSPPDPSHYTGVGGSISIEKATNGDDADSPTGPRIAVGGAVNWTYVVTNTGSVDLTDVTVTDDQGVTVTCPQTTLAVGEPMTCAASGTAVAGQYANLGTVTALTPNGSRVTDTDPSHYFGGRPSIDLEKATNGFDADTGTGPAIPVGDSVNWTYLVTNNGNEPLNSVSLIDNPAQTITCPRTALDVGESMTCTASGTAIAGQYENEATATGTPPSGPDVVHRDPSHYFGGDPGIDIEKLTNQHDADNAPGPIIPEGASVTWTYRVRNIGNQQLTDVTVEDDQLVDDTVINCGEGTDNVISDLAPSEVVLCTASDVAIAGQYANEATVTGTTPGFGTVTDRDPSHYFGAHPGLSLEKRVNDLDADVAPGPEVLVGDTVTFTFRVENTGNEDLTAVTVVDDQLGTIACPQDTLDVGERMICTVEAIATLGQHENTATATGTPPNGTPLTPVPDKGHYFGAHPGIMLEKRINGDDADTPPGVRIPAGDPVIWEFVITNTGNEELTDIVLTDDQLGDISCPRTTLDASGGANDSMTCTVTGTALPGQHDNIATVTAVPPVGPNLITRDPGHYFGTVPGFEIEKTTNGEDADNAPGPEIPVGEQVTWAFVVTNTGDPGENLTDIVVVDDKIGDICTIAFLPARTNLADPFPTATCSAFSTALPGQYENTATATATPPSGATITHRDPSHYTGVEPGLSIEKLTNGERAASAPGPYIPVGDPVTWTYRITNTGNQDLTGVVVTDDRIDATAINCGAGNNVIASLPAGGDPVECTATGTAAAGQYANIGTATVTPPQGPPLTPTSTSHYFGPTPGLQLVKKTNGESADTAPGPVVLLGDAISWTYEVTNTGNMTLTDVAVTDSDPGVSVSCPLNELAPSGEANDSMTCTASGTATAGQYANTGTATGTPPTGPALRVPNTSHYFGADPHIRVVKLTNGELIGGPPGNTLRVGDAVTWTYNVTNTGNVVLTGVGVTDDQGVTVTCPRTTLGVGETMPCTGSGIVTAGQYANQANATGTPPVGPPVTGITTSWYTGATPGISLLKLTNGEDAKTAPGPTIPVSDPVTWTYRVTNTGQQTLTDVTVTDDTGITVTCPATELAPGISMDCTASGTAVAGQYGNVGTAIGTPPTGSPVKSPDPSHYFGAVPSIKIEKRTNGEDADTEPGPSIRVGNPVSWLYIVTNDGNVTLTDVGVVDSDLGAVACNDDLLVPGATTTCTALGTAVAGQYMNEATATGTPPAGLTPPISTDPSHYYGWTPGIDLRKTTNGIDAATAPGPELAVGSTVVYEYLVTNTGDVPLTDIVVTDDPEGTASCPQTTLDPGEPMTCEIERTVVAGAYTNTGTVTGQPPTGTPVTSTYTNHHTGGTPPVCDADANGVIDINDIRAIMLARGRPADPGFDPRDADGDGVITRSDAKVCILDCTYPNCATAP